MDLIRRKGPVSRIELSRLSGLTAGAISRHAKELLLLGLIDCGETVGGQVGKPAQPLSIRPSAGYSIGAAFYPKQIDLVIVSFDGVVIAQKTCKFDEGSPEEAADIIAQEVDAMTAALHIRRWRCFGAGIGVSGYSAGSKTSRWMVSPLASWREKNLSEIFRQKLDMPVWVENITSAGAFAQIYNIDEGKFQDVVFLHIGYGVGAGIIIGGGLHVGRHGDSGSIGSFFPMDQPRPSGLDLLEAIRTSGISVETMRDIDPDDPAMQAVIEAWIERASEQISIVAIGAWLWLDPDAIVLGAPFPKEITQAIAHKVEAHINAHWTGLTRPKIFPSPLGEKTTSIGAALMPIHQVCSSAALPSSFRRVSA